MTLEEAREPIVSVRPTRDGQWETISTTKGENAEWRREWEVWWAGEGERLQRERPDWWREK